MLLEHIECLLHVSHFQFDAQVCRLDRLNSSHDDFEVRQDTNVSIEIESMLLREMDINELIPLQILFNETQHNTLNSVFSCTMSMFVRLATILPSVLRHSTACSIID